MDIFLTPNNKPFYISAKPVGATCNLDCTYCYYLEKSLLYPGRSKTIMTDDMLHRYVKMYIESHMRAEVMFTWHGGEPLLRGINFYKQALKYQQYYASKNNVRICNTLQTNGTLLNDDWCGFFKENNFLIGISIDGPAQYHDHYRVNKAGASTFSQAYRGMKLLQKHGVEYNILSVVNNLNVEHPLEIYNFFKQSGARYIQFTPVVERFIEDEEDEFYLSSPGETKETSVTEWSVGAQAYGRFLCAIFDEWVRKDVGEFFVINFDAMLANWAGEDPPTCVHARTCGHAMAMEYNGDVYACDHYVFPGYYRGNIRDKSLYRMAYSPEQIQFGNDKKDRLPQQCKSCKYLFACNGECPKNRILKTKDGEPGLNYLCEGFQLFYRHIEPYMEFMVNELRNNRSPANVMKAGLR
jgi:uncharacterized protein